MAKDSKTIIEDSIGALKRLKEEIKGYKDEMAAAKEGTQQWNDAAEKLRTAQEKLDKINRAAKGTLDTMSKSHKESINFLKERIKLLNQERNAMDMNSKEYKEATAELKVLNDKLREAGTSAGDWKANVGNYANSIKDAFSSLGGAANGLSGSIGGLNTGMLKLAANPVGAAILAITAAIGALAKGIKSSEENTNKWNEAMIPLRTVMVMIEKALQNVASKFTDFAKGLSESEKAGKVIQTVLQVLITLFEQTKTRINNLVEGVKNVFNRVKDFIGKMKEWGSGLKSTFEPVLNFVNDLGDKIKGKLQPVIDWIIDKYNWLAKSDLGKIMGLQTIEQVKESWEKAGETVEKLTEDYKETEEQVRKVVKAENELGKTLRGLMVAQANLRKEVAEADREYREALEDGELEKAQEALNKKKEKELALAKAGVAVAAAQLNVIKQQNALSDSTAEAKMAEAQAAAAVADAEAAVAEATAQGAREQKKLNSLIEADKKKKQADAYKESIKELTDELSKLDAAYNKTVATLKKPLRPEEGEINTNSLNAYYDAINANATAEYEAYKALQDAKIAELERFIEVQKALGNDTTQYELQLSKLRAEQTEGYAKQYEKMNETIEASDRARAKNLKALQKSEIKGYADLFDAVSGLFEQNTVAYKATATAKALINTYLAATSALAETPGGYVAKGIALAATLATGIAQVMQIWKTDVKNPSISTASSTPAIAEPSIQQQNPYTYSRQLQTEDEEDLLNQPIWVSVADIDNALNKVKVRDQESSW